MDSYRLIINNYDLSTSNIEQAVNYTGFTVIKAPKGPCTPVRIPAAGTAKIQDIFGVPSVDYPELYEATTFNADYDVYISAPYTKATVPVALVTPDGIYPAASNMVYNSVVEEFINGTADEDVDFPLVDEEGNRISTVLMDSRYPINTFGIDRINPSEKIYSDLYDLQSYPDYENGVIVNTGLFYTDMTAKGLTTFRLHNLPVEINGKNYVDITFNVNMEATPPCVELYVGDTTSGYKVGTIVYKSNGAYITLPYSATAGEGSTTANTPCILQITGETSTTANHLTNTYIVNNLKDYSVLKVLRTSWVKEYSDTKNIKGVILPKYPSERALHISFAKFNANKGYAVDDPSARNILKMSVYEDEAFHNISHPVSVTGSLESSAQDANGAYIGFTPSNTSYNDQNLIFVYSMDSKGFTKDDLSSLNKNIKQYPPIILDGGTREFNQLNNESYDPTSLHNIGWEIAKNEEYSSVHVFFDSERHNSIAPGTSSNVFYTLDKIHPLAGFIFNYTVSPDSISSISDPLAYGYNYWNICNEAIVILPNSDKIISPITGARALMQCRIIENRWGGVAPMYLNSGTPSMGGQLTVSGLYKLRYKYSKNNQEAFDDLNFNPVIQDHSYGVMVVGHKTCKSGDITDWSYIGHVSAFLTFQREVREQVMIPQLGKANNPYYRTLRKEQVLQLLSKRINGNNRIWAEASVDTSTADGCNDIQAQRARKFVINCKVKVDIFSEFVEFNFINVDQSMSVED